MSFLRRIFGRPRQRQALPATTFRPAVEPLEARDVPVVTNLPTAATLTAAEVQHLLLRAASVDSRQDAIIAVVDRNGRILGVRVEGGVSPKITNNLLKKVFAIDGAVAEARTAAFFANGQAPLTSRTIQFISQTTITTREVNSNPNLNNPNLPGYGPGFVAPVGLGGHFPPRVAQTPPVDLFAIEHTNRDSLLHPNAQGIKVPGQNVLQQRFNIDPAFVPAGQSLFAPESYGFVTNLLVTAQARGVGTLPGGIPIYKDVGQGPEVVGGIGVFFPGKTGFATEENSSLSDTFNPHKPDRSLEAEFIAAATVGILPSGQLGIGIPAGFLSQRIDLAGVTLDTIGPGGIKGPENLAKFGKHIHPGTPTGADIPVDAAGDTYLAGLKVPENWLVTPHDSPVGGLTADMVTRMIQQGIAAANATRAQIRLPIGVRTKMVFAVADKQGNILGLYRMNDATIFSIDVAVAKARNVSYYSDAAALQPIDQVKGLKPGASLSNRTFRYLAQPRFPEAVDGEEPGPFSILNDGNKAIGANYKSVLGHDAFFPQTNFRDQRDPIVNQNGIVFFPGSQGVYADGGNGVLIGGLGVSGDGVDQDDFITSQAGIGFGPPPPLRADNFFVRDVRLPFNKFPRNPLD
jgi:uncharacterized protein GlcG (DUF336 family)